MQRFQKHLVAVCSLVLLLAPLFSLLQPTPALAQSFNQQINYQGKLADNLGATVADGSYSMQFRLYTVASGGSNIWSETQSVTVTDGLFSVMLGTSTSLSGVDFNQTLYLGVTIEADDEMTPRKILGAVPAAFEANNSQTLGGVASTSFLRNDIPNAASALLSFTGGFVSSASSTISELTTGTTTVTTLMIDGEEFTSLSGGSSGLTNNAGTLTANISESNLNITGTPTNDYVLQASSTAAGGFVWAATSTLGFDGGASDFLSLTDTPGSFTANRLFFANSGGTAVTDSANLTFDGTNLVLGTDVGLSRGAADRLDLASGDDLNLVSGNLMMFGTDYLTGNNTTKNVTIGEGAGANFPVSGGSPRASVAIGYNAGQNASTTANLNNLYIGYQAGQNDSGQTNVILGEEAGLNNSGNGNFITGQFAAQNNSGSSNNIFGYLAGTNNAGNYNNILGNQAGRNSGLGSGNNLLGYRAGQVSSASESNMLGGYAGRSSTGSYNNLLGYTAGLNNAGSYTEFIGYGTGGLMNASSTVAIGRESLRGGAGDILSGSVATTTNNTALGAFSGYSAQTGADNNLLLGYRSGYSLTTGANNIIIGYDVEASSNTADGQLNIGNLLFGTGIDGTGTSLSSGNIGIGTSSPSSKLTVAGDVYITGALRDSTNSAGTNGYVLQTTGSGTQWVATSTLGLGGGASDFLSLTDTPGSYTANRLFFANSGGTAVTDSANLTFDGTNLNLGGTNTGLAFQGVRMFYASTTNNSIAIGENAGATFTADNTNTVAIGYGAGRYASTSGSFFSNFIGNIAGESNTGDLNNLIGSAAGRYNTGDDNNIIGYLAGYNNTGTDNNIFGDSAGYNNTGTDNNIFGDSAGYDNSGGNNNLLGANSGRSNSGSFSNMFGLNSGFNNTGDRNNFMGVSAGYENTGSYNSFIGQSAGYNNTGSYSEFIGYETGTRMSASSTIAIGGLALRGGSGYGANAATTTNNTVIGYGAGYNVLTGGDNNILLGYQAADSLTTGANNIIIGYDVEAPSNTGDNQLNIGNLLFGTGIDGTGTTLSSGNIGIGTNSPSKKLHVSNGGILSTTGDPEAVSALSVGLSGAPSDIVVRDKIAFAISSAGLDIVDVSEPDAMSIISSTSLTVTPYGAIEVQGQYAYIIDFAGGFAVVDISDLESPIEVETVSSSFSIDMQVIGKYLYLLTTGTNDLEIYDISNPGEPAFISGLTLTGNPSSIAVDRGRAAIGSFTDGVKLVDISNPFSPQLLETITTGSVGGEVDLRDNLLVYADGGAGNDLELYDVSDIDNITLLDAVETTHGAIYSVKFTAQSVILVGNGGSADTIEVYDISDRSNIVKSGGVDPGSSNGLGFALSGNYGYVISNAASNLLWSIDFGGITTPSLEVGSLLADTQYVRNLVAGNGEFYDGLSVSRDTLIGGALTVTGGASSTLLASNTNPSFVVGSGYVGIGTSTPGSKLTVAGDVYITGALRDSSNSAGTTGYVLQTTGSGTQWVATSTLGIGGGGASDFLSLTDTPGSYTANRLFFANSGGTAVTDSANLTFDGVNLNLGGTNTGLAFQGTRMFYASTTNDSIAIGEFAGETFTNNTQENIAIGYGAGRYASTTGADFNTYIGLLAGSANTGNDNILIGYTTGMNNTGQYVSAIGESAAENNTGSYVQALGQNAGFNNSGDTSSLIGTSAGYENTGDYVAAVGYNAGFSNDGTQNSFFGTSAGYGNQGTENTFLGWSAGASNSGNNNFAVGTDAGRFNSGSSNNFMGTSAGDNNEGSYNTFIGEVAGRNNIGNFNDFIGYRAGQNLESTSTVAIGGEALRGVSGIYQAVNNVAIGYHAGYNAQTGASNNLLLGYQAADSLTSGANNIIIGYDVEAPSNTGDNQLNIGNLLFGTGIDGTGTTLSSGNIGIGTSTPNAKLAIAQSADNEGIIVNGFDDEATSYIGLTINELGYADVNSNTILEFNVSGTDRQLRITNLGSEFNFNNNSAQDFRVNGTSANLIFADAGTNRVGIGTSSPASKLDVWGDFRVGTSSAPNLFVDTSANQTMIGTSTAFGTGGLYLEDSTLTFRNSDFLSRSNTISTTPLGYLEFTGSSAHIFDIGVTEALRITSTGSVFNLNGNSSYNFEINGDTDGHLFFVNASNDAVGISTSTAAQTFTVDGSTYLVGALYDSTNSAGTTGYILQTTGSGTQWVATSTLGLGGGGASDFLSLTDTPGSYTANRLFFANSGGTAVTDSANLTFDGTNLNLGGTNTGLAFQGTRMFYASTTNDSIAIGENAGDSLLTTGLNNIAIGLNALTGNSTGDENIAIGVEAGQFQTGSESIFIGGDAGRDFGGINGTVIGYAAARDGTSDYSVILGNDAARDGGANYSNVIGYQSGLWAGFSQSNAIGYQSGYNAGASSTNLIGYKAAFNTRFIDSVVIGDYAGYGADSGETTNNTILGNYAGYAISATGGAENNLLLGYRVADSLTTGANNIIIGYDVEAPSNTADGQLNIGNLLFGTRIDGAGTTLSSGNIGIGTSSPSSKLDVWGDFSLKSNLFASVGPSGDSFFIAGATSTSVLSGATNNLAFGSDSQFSLTTGDNNISFGNGTLYSNTLGNENIAIGLSAINSNSGNGSNNIALGTSALENNGSGNENIAFGSRALFTNDSGGNSIAIGTEALYQNSGSSTIAIGYRAGDNAVSVDRSIIIGYDVDFASNTADDQLNIGNLIFGTGIDGTGTTLSSGNIGIGVTDPSAKLDVVSNVADTYAAELVNTSVDGFGAYVYVGNNDADKSTLTLENSDGVFFSALNNGNIGIGTSSPASVLNINGGVGSLSTGLTFGDGDSGIYEPIDDQLNFMLDSQLTWRMSNGAFWTQTGTAPRIQDDVTNGVMFTRNGDQDTGLGVAPGTLDNQLALYTGNTVALLIDNNQNVGIGTTTPSSKLSIANTGFSGAGTIGLDQYLTTANSVAAALQYGSRTYISNISNTATTSLVGNAINVADNTTFGNTVRGLEVQADLGSNTQGENTALSGFARTFGVRGFTSADAGGSFEPAGGFFETGGTTQGNAIRGYSSSITSASLLSLFQDSSDFTGTGLEMNFGNTTGDFASTSSKYLDFQNAGTSIFTVSAFGTTTIGANDGTTVNMAGLQIGYGGICVDNDGACTASTTGNITAVSYGTANSDLAENYFSADNLAPGELVTLGGGLSVDRAETASELPILGVVSTKPGLTLGFDDVSLNAGETAYPIALSGRVPVKLSTENGPIEKGDRLMLSSLPGIAMKATGTGMTIGIALEDFDDTRMYSDTYLNQFADDMVDPVYEPVVNNTDPRINDGCYYGGGSAAGDAPCVPLVSTTTAGQIAEVNNRLETESVAAQIANLRREGSDRVTLDDGSAVQVGQVVMFVENQYKWVADDQLAMLGMLSSAELLEEADEDETFFDRLVALANSFVDGVFSIFELRADRVEVADELCVDGVCINADDLRRLLEQPADSGAGGTPPPTTPVPADDGEPADDGVTPTESESVIDDTEEGTSATTTSTSTYIGTDDSGTVPDDSSVASSSDTGSETDSEPPSADSEEAPPDDQTTTPEPPQADAEPKPEEVIELEEEGEESSAEIEVSTDEQEAVNSEII